MLSGIFYRFGRFVIRSYAMLMIRMDIHRHADLPAGPVLFAANHPSTTDPVFFHLITKKPMSMLITSKAFSIPLLGAYMRRMGHICVNIGQGREVMEQARQTLKKGRSVAIFPEGLISPSRGRFNRPRTGVAHLALTSGVPVVPVGIYLADKNCRRIKATFEGKPDIVNWYLHGPYAITIGKPLHFQGDVNNTDIVKTVAEKIMQSIRALALDSQRRVCQFWL